MSASDVARSSTQYSAARKSVLALLSCAEWMLLGFIVATGIASVVGAAVRQQAVDWLDFLPELIVSLELVLIGVCIRKTQKLARIAMGLIAFGMIQCFLVCYAILTFTVFPFVNPMVDQQLLAADALFGFSWVDSVNYLALYPKAAVALTYIYFSILPQMVFVIVFLSFLRLQEELNRFLLVGFLCMIASVVIWWLFPSVGPAAYEMVSEDVQQKVHLIANADYGEKMWRYATEGNLIIAKSKMAGVIAFPSMHIVMTCMVLWFTRRTWAFVPLLVLNFAMPVATVLQGGHHVMDLIGGFAVFGLCLWAAVRLVPDKTAAEFSNPFQSR